MNAAEVRCPTCGTQPFELCHAVRSGRVRVKVHGQRERFAAGLTTPPKKKDRKRQKARDGWWQVRQFALGRSEFRCEYPECYLLADHVHHILPRSAGGTDDLGNLAALCWSHHRWVHDNPAKARELGLLRSRYGQTIR